MPPSDHIKASLMTGYAEDMTECVCVSPYLPSGINLTMDMCRVDLIKPQRTGTNATSLTFLSRTSKNMIVILADQLMRELFFTERVQILLAVCDTFTVVSVHI